MDSSTATVPQLKPFDLQHARKAVAVLFRDVKFGAGECIEVRAVNKKKGLTACGWFDNPEALAKAVCKLARDGFGVPATFRFLHDNVYWTCNPVADALLSRQEKNKIDWAGDTTSDHNITRRIWLPVDIDPLRAAGVSATAEERNATFEVANLLMQKLHDLGIEDVNAIGGTSGNGYHILIRIDLPNDDPTKELLKRCLAAMELMVGTPNVEIDPKVFNAARIMKAYGTLARKGVSTEQRPWRMSGLTMVPENLVPVSRELLEKLAAFAPQTNPKRAINQTARQGPWTEENTEKYLREGTKWVCEKRSGRSQNEIAMWLGACIKDPNHNDAALIVGSTPFHVIDIELLGDATGASE